MTQNAVNNELYRRLGHAWWDDEAGEFSTIRFFINPVRFAYYSRVYAGHRADGRPARLLDVGCGGGFLAEDFARLGLTVSGIDPAPETIDAARAHARASGLQIDYSVARGEKLPFSDSSFDIVTCCDVLEHVDSPGAVIDEIARVLKQNGVFCYDTINRTFRSWLVAIKVMQEWPFTAISSEKNPHVWKQFIKPRELKALLEKRGLEQKQYRGISVRNDPVSTVLLFRRRAQGHITFKELGERLCFAESDDTSVSYMGHAVKL